MATKIQFKYGQWAHDVGCNLSVETPGLVVFNGRLNEIYLDGKTFGTSEASFQELLQRVTNLENFRAAIHVDEYAQASISNDGENSQLLLANIGQGAEGSDNDGKIFTTGNFSVKLEGVYDDNTNKIATQSTVKNAVDTLRAEILGTIDPEELEKTLDTIKEIQDVLINGSYTILHDVTDPETGITTSEEIQTKRVVTTDPDTGTTTIEYTNGDDGEGKVVYATEDPDTGEISYVEGYHDIKKVPSIDSLVASVDVNENKTNGFVSTSRNNADITIGVNYGTFKTGHGNVMDETSTAFVNGIATVEDVQKYIEERLSWISYETSADSLAADINAQGDDVTVNNNADMSDSLIITNS